jgi:hypothetical protein
MLPQNAPHIRIRVRKTNWHRQGSKQQQTQEQQQVGSATTRPRRRRRHQRMQWDVMIKRLQQFYNKMGHSLVTKDHDDVDLYKWTLSVRRNYRHQVQAAKPDSLVNNNDSDSCLTRAHTFSSAGITPNTTLPNTTLQRDQPQPRPTLSPEKLTVLEQLEFPWDDNLQKAQWQRRYNELCAFRQQHGHCRVPANHGNGLGVWVRNQRRECAKHRGTTHRSTRTAVENHRLELLQRLGFEWPRSHDDAWGEMYRELVAYYGTHGHSNVPEQYPDQIRLGHWCMNQRTAYKRYCYGEPTALTSHRIQQLQRVQFVWNYREFKWYTMQERLKQYYLKYGHLDIHATDEVNRDLRIWLILQRHHYNRRQQRQGLLLPAKYSNHFSDRRIAALERAIPNFSWKAHEGSGPKTEDWVKLFQAMREKGIKPGARPKEHWFEGINPFSVEVKETWTDQDLLELWNQQDADDDGEF